MASLKRTGSSQIIRVFLFDLKSEEVDGKEPIDIEFK